jgi:asparagine synthase (glutamine-hydrolysing)
MCGIVGILAYGARARPVSRSELLGIRDSMATRGPDGVGEWIGADGKAGLGHRRLAIIDLSEAAAQPMTSGSGASVISFNGEIYNYRNLRAELEQQGQRFRTASDTEVILALYEREGERMLSRLRGMFALVIWDARRRGMLLARDPMGIKPLYYSDDGGTLRAASQVKALLVGGVEASPDPAGCVSFFLLGYVAEPFTIRRRIRALPAGHSLWVDAAGVGAPRAYFSVRDTLLEAERAADPRAAPANGELIGAAIKASVAAHMVADVPVGLFLSAGIDSTSIASLARDYSAQPLRTLTLGFREYEGSSEDEVPTAEEVARIFRTDHRTLRVIGRDFAVERERLLTAMDQPTTDGPNAYFVSKAAHEIGLKVALCGLGGDELFGGYPSYSQVPSVARALRPLRFLRGMGRALRKVSAPLLGRLTSPKYAGLLEYGTSLEDAYLLRRALYMPWELPGVLDMDVVRPGWAELDLPARLRATIAGLEGDRTRIAALEMSWYMRNQLLRDADWAGMAHSLEIRTPFVDAELLRQLAPLLAGPAAPSKLAMVKSTPAGGIEKVVSRPKSGFTVPMRQWLADSVEPGSAAPGSEERGLRGWAKLVYRHHVAA